MQTNNQPSLEEQDEQRVDDVPNELHAAAEGLSQLAISTIALDELILLLEREVRKNAGITFDELNETVRKSIIFHAKNAPELGKVTVVLMFLKIVAENVQLKGEIVQVKEGYARLKEEITQLKKEKAQLETHIEPTSLWS